jgi:hypothetical protein
MAVNTTGDYSKGPSGITADLSGRTVVNGAGGTDMLATGVTTLVGSTHDDDFVASTGDGAWTIDGGAGYDLIAVYNAGRSQADITNDSAGTFNLTLAGTAIHALGVDQINFIDGSVGYSESSVAAQIVRLYQAAFDRAPDAVGLAYWTNQLNNGMTLDSVANAFLASPEFAATPAGANPGSATAFMIQLWQNVYHAAPDPRSVASGVNGIDSGEYTKAQNLVAFSESGQNYVNTAGLFASGIYVPDEQAAQVARLYYSTLDRAPDYTGLYNAVLALKGGNENLQQVAAGLFSSAEFLGKYGSLSDLGFVDVIYRNVYGAPADPSTEAAWVGAIASGTQTRASMVVGMSESPQHVVSLAPVIEANGIKFM